MRQIWSPGFFPAPIQARSVLAEAFFTYTRE